MIVLFLFEFIIVALFLWFAVSQLIGPAVLGRPLFPIFRETKMELENDIIETKELINEKELEEELVRLKSELANKSAELEKAKVEMTHTKDIQSWFYI